MASCAQLWTRFLKSKTMEEEQNIDDISVEEEAKASEEELLQEGQGDSCKKCKEYLAGWKRAQADYQNLLKEAERQKNTFAKYANEKLLSDLLPALDQFALVLKHIPNVDTLPKEQMDAWKNWLVGVRAVKGNWDQAAKEAGLEPIATDAEFDPTFHEAVAEEVSEEVASGNIARVIETGWKLHGKVLRPAKVIVAK